MMAAPPIIERHLHHFHRRSPIKEAVRVATTANITIATALNNGDSLDGITLATGDRVLVKDQSTASQNGIYVVAASPARAYDVSTDDPSFGYLVYVRQGTVNGGSLWTNTNTATPTIDTTALTFAEITSGGGFTMPWFNVEDYGAVHDAASTTDADIAAATDDTSAIQDAIDACLAAGGGTVFFPNGIYAIKGALQDTTGYNAQLTIGNNSISGSNPPVSIAFVGMGPNAQSNNTPILTMLPSQSGAILRSDWAGSITDSPAVISAGPFDAVYPDAGFNWTFVTFRNIEIRTPANPKLSAIEMGAAAMCRNVDMTVSTQVNPDTMAAPSNANAVGIGMPNSLNSNSGDSFDNAFVDGYYSGVRLSEQSTGPLLAVAHCTRGVVVNGLAASNHAMNLGRLLLFSCITGIAVLGSEEQWLNIDLLDIEHDPDTMTTTWDIDDGSNLLRGFISWHTTDYATGPEDNLLVNGGTGLSLHGSFARRWKLNHHVEIPDSTEPATPDDGGTIWSTGGLPEWKSQDGTSYPMAVSDAAVQNAGRWEVVVTGSPPEPVTTPDDTDYLYAWVTD